MRKILSIILCCAVVLATRSASVDSLVADFNKTGKLETANAFFDAVYRGGLLTEPLRFTADTPIDSVRQQLWYWAAEYYYDQADYDKAIAYAKQALPLISEGSELEADCQNLLAIANVRLCHYAEAAHHAGRCHELDLESGDESRISSSLNTLAGIYLAAGQPDEAEQYIVRGIKMARKSNNPTRLAVLLGMASEIYHALQRDSLALQYIDEAYRLDSLGGHVDRMHTRLAQRASVLIGLQRYKEAEQVLDSVIPYLRKAGEAHSLGIALNKMGRALSGQGRMEESVKPYQESAEIFARLGDPYNEIHAHRGLYEALWQTNPELAKQHFYRFSDLKDSIYTHSSAESLAHYNAKFGNDWLTLENHAERRAKHWAYNILVVLVLVALGIVFYLYRRSQRHIELNEKLRAVVEELKKEQQQRLDENQQLHAPETPMAFRQRVEALVNEKMSSGRMDVRSIASDLGMTPSKFRQELARVTDESAANFILRIRMERACHLLETRDSLTIQEVATLCGYSETSNFARTFKKYAGVTPVSWKESLSKMQK